MRTTKMMQRCARLAGVALLLAALSGTAMGQGWQREAERYGWRLDLDAARDAARESGKPLMVVIRCIP